MSKESALASLGVTTPPPAAPEVDASGALNTEANTTVTPGTEAAVTEAPKLTSTRFAAIEKREAKLQADREAFKKEREALETEKNAWKAKITPYEELEVLKAKDPIEAMKRLGFTETDIFNFAASHSEKKEPTPQELAEAAAQKKIDENNARQKAESDKAAADRDERTLATFRSNIHSRLDEKKEEFEYCAHHGALAEELAFNTVRQVFADTCEYDKDGNVTKPGEVITPDEALAMVEKYYEEEDKAMNTIKKRAAKSAVETPPPGAVQSSETEKPKAEVSPKPKTITNAATATSSAIAKKRETPQEKCARLENALRTGVYTPAK